MSGQKNTFWGNYGGGGHNAAPNDLHLQNSPRLVGLNTVLSKTKPHLQEFCCAMRFDRHTYSQIQRFK